MNSRFVILRHDVGKRLARTDHLHFDWMFQVGDVLRTWATKPVDDFSADHNLAADRLPDHRLQYLGFEGEIDGDRGWVSRVVAGEYNLLNDDAGLFAAELQWREGEFDHTATVECYRSSVEEARRLDESRADWTLRFSVG